MIAAGMCPRLSPVPPRLHELLLARSTRSMLQATLPSAYEDRQPIKELVERLMGRDPAQRFDFIQSRTSAEGIDA